MELTVSCVLDISEVTIAKLRTNGVEILDAKIHGRRLTAREQRLIRETGELKKDPLWPKLRGMIWLAWIFCNKNWSWADLKAAIGENRERSPLVDQWEAGSKTPKGSSVEKLEKEVPGSRELYELPLWSLLANFPRTTRQCKRSLAHFLDPKAIVAPYRYPSLLGLGDRWHQFEPTHREDSDTMVVRADIYAFTTLVALVREAEAEYRDEEHCYHLANLYRMLAPLSRNDYLYNHIFCFALLIQGLHARVPYSQRTIGVDWRVLNLQIESRQYSPLVPLRPHTEMGGELELDIDPIIYADIYRKPSVGSPLEFAEKLLVG